jgi:hypothetical protein
LTSEIKVHPKTWQLVGESDARLTGGRVKNAWRQAVMACGGFDAWRGIDFEWTRLPRPDIDRVLQVFDNRSARIEQGELGGPRVIKRGHALVDGLERDV